MNIDLTGINTKSAFHQSLKKQLDFPEWAGENWDAFWDTITGLIEMPEKVILQNWQEFELACPRDMQILREIIEQYNDEIPDKKILLG
ncbi:barstar family protein [Hymenobacter sp. 5317J-9]|uniref:barstar family protein n=1 Tax=Hymenobacter sp. 5317J-9 TaxID=2932250 RepID=UPI001FD70A70|nr:barstar family protein [Hymenobacter sp. 5317J-9]UOQ97019.1 barstar family protein [Hymenobacter sp. 5317J-9]